MMYIWLLRYETQQTEVFVILGHFLHFDTPNNHENQNFEKLSVIIIFSIWVFFHEYSQITEQQGKEQGIPLTPHYHFYQLQTHLDISQAITAESSPLQIARS